MLTRRTSTRWTFANAVLWSSLALCAPAAAEPPRETVTVVADDFERGRFGPDWDATSGSDVRVVHRPGEAAGGDHYARVQGVGPGQGGLGATFANRFRDPFATDFTIALDVRIEPSEHRQFGLILVATGAAPVAGQATVNLRYEDGAWAAYSDRWNVIEPLGAIAPETWNRLVVRGRNWGSGTERTAVYDLEVTDHRGETRRAAGLRIYQGDPAAPDLHGARSFSLNDAFGDNRGFDVDNVHVTAIGRTGILAPKDPVAFSGVYPHLAVANNTRSESGIGAVVDWAGKLWYMTYPAHFTAGSPDNLYSVTPELAQRVHPRYPGSTNANRYLDASRGLMFIGSAIVDAEGAVRALPVAGEDSLRGRLTGTGPHLSDPDKVYYMTMEEGFYEVDLSDLDARGVTTLRIDGNVGSGSDRHSGNLPGRHGKGFYVAQGHVFYSNNGDGGCLVEWDGTGDPAEADTWTLVDRNKYNEITTRRGVAGNDPGAADPVWAVGWDHRSVLLNVRDAATGRWTRYRLPKGSYTHDHEPGHYVEWPRIRDVGLSGGDLAMNEHGLLYRFPAGFRPADTRGIVPLGTFHKMIVDYVAWDGRIVLGCNDVSPFAHPLYGWSHSNLLFLEKERFEQYGGRPMGFGGPWVRDAVAAGEPSEAFLVSGFAHRTLHLAHTEAEPVDFTIEVDPTGRGDWEQHAVVTVEPAQAGSHHAGYRAVLLPAEVDAQRLSENGGRRPAPGGSMSDEPQPSGTCPRFRLDAPWLRVRTNRDAAAATAYLHLTTPQRPADEAMTRSLAAAGRPARRSQGLLLTASAPDFPLQFAADILGDDGSVLETGFYRAQLDDDLKLQVVPVDDPEAEAGVRDRAATTQDFGVDDASVYIDRGGVRYRLPRGSAAFDTTTATGRRRGIREVVTERAVMNIHGTFYELPRDNSGGMRRIRPITTHNLDIFDYVSWRGMLVLSGNLAGAAEDGHYVASADGKVGLWFGNVDDLWRFGPPRGEGGPWMQTPVEAGKPSDPYLMYGYDRKSLALSHEGKEEIDVRIEVDVLGDNRWETFDRVAVGPGGTVRYDFPDGYSAHWVRLATDHDTTATAQFTYTTSGDSR